MKKKHLLKTLLSFLLFSFIEIASAQTAIFNSSMTITPYGNVNSPGWEAFGNIIDNNINTKFLDFTSDDGMGFTVFLGSTAKIASSITITTAGDQPGRDPKNYQIFGSNDGSSFTSIATGNIGFITTRQFSRKYHFINNDAYKYYRINFTNTWEPLGMMQLAEVQLYTCEVTNSGSISANQTISGAISSTPVGEANLNSGFSAQISPAINDYQCADEDCWDYINIYTPPHTAAQSFRTSDNVTLNAIKINVANVIQTGTYTLRIFQGAGDAGAELSNQAVSIFTSGTNTFLLNTTLALTAGQSYTFKLETRDNNAKFNWTYSSDSDYPNGSGYVDGNTNNGDFNFQLVYQNNVNWQNITLSNYTGGVQKWQMATDSSFPSPVDIASTSATLASYLIGDISQTTYFRAVLVGCSTIFSDYVTIAVTPSITPITWTGTNSTNWSDEGNWSNGLPISTSDVIIAAATNQPLLTSNVTINSLTIDTGASLTVPTGLNLTVSNHIDNSGTLTIENNANLIQTAEANTNLGTGTAIVKRNSAALKRLDYTMWSSPVFGDQTLEQFSPNTSRSPNRFYTYDAANNLYTNATTTNTFSTGVGYLIRMPNDASTDPTAYAGQFTGTLNNGTLPLNGLTAGRYYAVGNPYPSTIDATAFLSGNSTDGTLYFWRKTNGAIGSSYAAYTTLGPSESGGITPNGTIQVGQGFIVKATSTSLSFTNAMRETAPTSTQFLKTKNTTARSRLWLDLSYSNARMNQILIGYLATATLGVDPGIDGKYFNDSKIALTSIINGEEYVIQGRPTFEATDVVALGFKTDVAGSYTIALNSFDGVFAEGQDIYLIDTVAGIETDLKAGSYSFTAAIGVDNTRFKLKYQRTVATIWNGTSWDFGTPTAVLDAVIDGALTTSVSFTAKSLTVNATKSLTVATGTNFTVAEALVNNGTITVENNANLIQTAVANTNSGSGTAIVKRDSNALKRLDYTMWSSPVNGAQKLEEFSPNTSRSPNRFYTYDAINNVYTTVATTSTFTPGVGYLIRMPNDASTDPTAYAGQFTGTTFNNGTVTLTGLTADKYYSVGNPYPSTIDADAFLAANPGTLYFWRKTNGAGGTAYATYSVGLAGGVASSGGITPNGTIQVGQGFIVKTGAEATTLSFTNGMRISNTDNQFLKTKKADKSRLWLDLSDATGMMNQVLIGYLDTATLGVDAGIDGKYFNDSKIALTSIINGEEYVIQGRPTFEVTDVVPLSFKTDVAGTYAIALNSFDGVFASGQDIYLVDAITGKETDLKTESYSFTAAVGVDTTRFSLKYQKTLKVEAPIFNENSVKVYKNNGAIYVNSTAKTIKTIEVYDVQGRLIAQQKNVNAAATTINNLKGIHQMLIVKVSADDNSVVSKKVLNY